MIIIVNIFIISAIIDNDIVIINNMISVLILVIIIVITMLNINSQFRRTHSNSLEFNKNQKNRQESLDIVGIN